MHLVQTVILFSHTELCPTNEDARAKAKNEQWKIIKIDLRTKTCEIFPSVAFSPDLLP